MLQRGFLRLSKRKKHSPTNSVSSVDNNEKAAPNTQTNQQKVPANPTTQQVSYWKYQADIAAFVFKTVFNIL